MRFWLKCRGHSVDRREARWSFLGVVGLLMWDRKVAFLDVKFHILHHRRGAARLAVVLHDVVEILFKGLLEGHCCLSQWCCRDEVRMLGNESGFDAGRWRRERREFCKQLSNNRKTCVVNVAENESKQTQGMKRKRPAQCIKLKQSRTKVMGEERKTRAKETNKRLLAGKTRTVL